MIQESFTVLYNIIDHRMCFAEILEKSWQKEIYIT